jgi:hypothetical protein
MDVPGGKRKIDIQMIKALYVFMESTMDLKNSMNLFLPDV